MNSTPRYPLCTEKMRHEINQLINFFSRIEVEGKSAFTGPVNDGKLYILLSYKFGKCHELASVALDAAMHGEKGEKGDFSRGRYCIMYLAALLAGDDDATILSEDYPLKVSKETLALLRFAGGTRIKVNAPSDALMSQDVRLGKKRRLCF